MRSATPTGKARTSISICNFVRRIARSFDQLVAFAMNSASLAVRRADDRPWVDKVSVHPRVPLFALEGSRCPKRRLRVPSVWWMCAALLIGYCARILAQQPITFQYFYDDLNQLTKVLDSTGVVVQYVYDPVGNILQINRSSVAPGALTIFNVTPSTVATGGTLTIQGQGFRRSHRKTAS
jgi:YD repeat-containing protein